MLLLNSIILSHNHVRKCTPDVGDFELMAMPLVLEDVAVIPLTEESADYELDMPLFSLKCAVKIKR